MTTPELRTLAMLHQMTRAYACDKWNERWGFGGGRDSMGGLMMAGLVEARDAEIDGDYVAAFVLTRKGKTHMDHLLSLPLPDDIKSIVDGQAVGQGNVT